MDSVCCKLIFQEMEAEMEVKAVVMGTFSGKQGSASGSFCKACLEGWSVLSSL